MTVPSLPGRPRGLAKGPSICQTSKNGDGEVGMYLGATAGWRAKDDASSCTNLIVEGLPVRKLRWIRTGAMRTVCGMLFTALLLQASALGQAFEQLTNEQLLSRSAEAGPHTPQQQRMQLAAAIESRFVRDRAVLRSLTAPQIAGEDKGSGVIE